MDTQKMIVVCPCGTKLRVSMASYLKMRCPKCQLMLAQEIERQAARNSKAILEITAVMLNDRMTAKHWSGRDEMLIHILAKHEVESHGGTFSFPTAPTPQQSTVSHPVSFEEQPEVVPMNGNGIPPTPPAPVVPDVTPTSPLHTPVPEPPVRKIRTKLKRKVRGGRR